MRVNNHVLRAASGGAFKERIAEYENSINIENLNKTSELVISTTNELAEREVKNRPDWFMQSKETSSNTLTLETKLTKLI